MAPIDELNNAYALRFNRNPNFSTPQDLALSINSWLGSKKKVGLYPSAIIGLWTGEEGLDGTAANLPAFQLILLGT